MGTLQQSWVQSQHHPTQRDLKGSRKGNTEMSIKRPKFAVKTEEKKIFKKRCESHL
jgi:hypothetical protein